ncbi:MAG: formimidoylglutamase [Bacteroidales bacterium]|nr:formimidoylglutamase [Bacteroidales bacterium]
MYKPTKSSIWEGRTDREDGDAGIRWHYLVKCIDLEKEEIPEPGANQRGFAFIGFRCDEGVKRNMGRAGAANGPEAIRRACRNFACHFDPGSTLLLDCGDVIFEGTRLRAVEEELAGVVSKVMKQGYFPIILGGGHEVSFGGYKGVSEAFSQIAPSVGILNFDAHFDLREFSQQISSGTPFLQLAELCLAMRKPFKYMCLGIQPQSNTQALFQKANNLKVKYILGEDLQAQKLPEILHTVQTFLGKSNACYLTVDMDVFDGSDAPGVSAPAIPGVDKQVVFLILKSILASKKVVAFDVAETNPLCDPDGRTSKLAAYLVYLLVNTL